MCKNCLYRKNCQFLAKHKNAAVENCTAFKSEAEYAAEIKKYVVKEFLEHMANEYSNFDEQHEIITYDNLINAVNDFVDKAGNGSATNFERIHNMTVEEMTDFLMKWFVDCMMGDAPTNVRKWLESEAQDNAGIFK